MLVCRHRRNRVVVKMNKKTDEEWMSQMQGVCREIGVARIGGELWDLEQLSIDDPESVRKFFISIAVAQAQDMYSHAFRLGCGQSTMLRWVRRTPKGQQIQDLDIPFTRTDVRRCLMNFVRLGLLAKTQSKTGHSIFTES